MIWLNLYRRILTIYNTGIGSSPFTFFKIITKTPNTNVNPNLYSLY